MARSTTTPGEGQQRKEAETSKNELLMVAVRKGELTTVRRLVDRSGADVSTVNRSGLSCLQLAIVGGHVKLAEYLIQKGANIHSIDNQGWTALHDAAQMDMKGMVRKLLSKGCRVTASTDLGELPIDVAGSVNMEKMLCSEMAARGEEKLSKDYEVYLGLRHLKDSNNKVVFPVSHRGTLPLCYGARMSPPKLQRRHTSPAHLVSSEARYPIKPTAGRQRREDRSSSTNDPEVRTPPREQKKAETERTEKITSSSKLQEAVIDRPPKPDSIRHHRASLVGINSSRQHRAANSVTSSRRSGIGRSYERSRELGVLRSSASISAALGVCFDNVTTAFEEDSHSKDTLDILDRSPSSEATSAAVVGNKSRVEADLRKRKVSFCDNIIMARTKIASGPVATAEKERGVILSKEGASAQDLENGSSEEAYKVEERGKNGSSSDGEDEDAPCLLSSSGAIANLKRLPRKSSIVTPERRRSSADGSGRRRSVTFQPEVLLQEMVLDGDMKAVQDILASGVLLDINKLSPAGLTALHQSAIDGNLACAKVLVANGAHVNCVDCELWTPLHAAAMSGRIDIVRFLLSNGADPLLKNEANETAYDVAKTGPIRKLLLCSMNGKNLDADEISDGEYSDEEEQEYSHVESESDDDGEEPCYFGSPKTSHETSASPSPDLAEHPDNVFLNGSKSPDLDSPTKKPRDILDSSSSCGSLLEPETDRVKDLEETERLRTSNHGNNTEDVSITEMVSEDQGISTMDGSSDCSHRSRTLSEDEGTLRDVLDSELVPGSLDYRYQDACLHCEVDSLLKLVKHKAEIEVNRINKSSGITALHHAVLEENFAMVQHLVKDFECDIQIKDRDGWTPLHAASAVGDIRIAQFLLDNGAKASVLNNQCEFPVDVAEDKAMEKLLKNAMLGPGVGKLFKGKFA